MSTKIQHVTYHQIYPEKWNRLILEAPNGLFYALSWFLDSAIHDWEALIKGDYEAAMVLPVFKRMGIPFIYGKKQIARDPGQVLIWNKQSGKFWHVAFITE